MQLKMIGKQAKIIHYIQDNKSKKSMFEMEWEEAKIYVSPGCK